MRKWLSLFLFIAIVCGAGAGVAEVIPPSLEVPEGIQPGSAVRIGSDIPLSGYFATDMWGSNASDMDVRMLLHGYETVVWTDDMGMMINPTVVKDVSSGRTNAGLVFTLELTSGLTYNDGTPITAKDYVFSLLLGTPALRALGAASQGYGHVVGYTDYQDGTAQAISGVRLLSDTELSITVRSEYMPYYYDLAAISIRPYPPHVIAPGCEIVDDGSGVRVEGDFTTETLQKTMLDPSTGYLYNPRVTSGPYQLEYYIPDTGVASFTANERFIGDPTGQTPHIERIELCYVPEEEAPAALASGEIDLQVRVMDSDVVQRVMQAISQGTRLQTVAYPRTGFAFLAFACEMTPTSSQAVRRAIAMCLDRDALVAAQTTGTAMRAYGYYGVGQWMVAYTDEGDAETGAEPLEVITQLPKLDIPMSLTDATALLVTDGWTLGEDGQPYKGGTRYKQEDGGLVPLVIRWAVTEGDPTAAAVRQQLEETLPQVGIGLEVTELDFPALLAHYYRQEERTYSMFSLASNFTYIFDPYYDFNTDPAYQGLVNTSGLRDEGLMNAALAMQRTNPGERRTYVERWLAFQQRFVELSPMVPLYSNVYFDVLQDRIEGYDATGNTGWSSGIARAYIQEEAAQPAAPTGGGEEDSEDEIVMIDG